MSRKKIRPLPPAEIFQRGILETDWSKIPSDKLPEILAHIQSLEGDLTPALRRIALQQFIELRALIEACFPDLWYCVEAALSTYATLLLHGPTTCTSLILVGPPSGGKTTVNTMLFGCPGIYRSDNFTAAAFVSQNVLKTKEELARVDLLPRVRHHLLNTKDLVQIFRGRTDDLVRRFQILVNVLDGRGYTFDAGAHGQRGYEGDYYFAWLGSTTPFNNPTWRVMSQLGSRLFFLRAPDEAMCPEALVKARKGLSYRERLELCQAAVHLYLTCLTNLYGGYPYCVRSVAWHDEEDDSSVIAHLSRLAYFTTQLRSLWGYREDEPKAPEIGHRCLDVLTNLARGHALLYDRESLTRDDLPMVERIAIDSVPHANVAWAMKRQGVLSAADVKRAAGVSSVNTAKDIMDKLAETGVYETYWESEQKFLRFSDEFKWMEEAR